MQSALALLVTACCLSLAHGNDNLDVAPVDAPLDAVVDVEECNTNSDCTWAGDSDAQCDTATKTCTCAANTGIICQIGTSGRPTGSYNFVLTLRNLACNSGLLTNLLEAIKARLENTGLVAPKVLGICGSVTLIVNVEVPQITLADTVQNTTTSLRDALLEASAYTGTTASDQLLVQLHAAQTSSGQEVCAANAVNTLRAYDGRCLVLECAAGYTLSSYTVNDKELQTCYSPIPVPRSTDSDDELSGAAIAAIVVGVVLTSLVILTVAFFCLRKPSVAEAQNNEPYVQKNDDINV